ncbi:MAG: CPBP family glutamic-type intramembrane protease [bacterium]|nr:CPBP family glutamic-type intramembrane protease [bacterium]
MNRVKSWAIAEVVTIFALVMVAIWFFQENYVPFVVILIAIAGVMIVSSAVRMRGVKVGDYTETLGLGCLEKNEDGRNYLKLDCSWIWKLALLALLGLTLILIAGYFFRPEFWLERKFWRKTFSGVQGYIVWGVIQQFVLHAGVTSRLYSIFVKSPDPKNFERRAALLTALVSGVLFFLAHTPNPKLMIVTPIAGAATAYVFLNCRNVWILGIAHGILGTAVEHCLPLNINVGPNYW